MKDKLVWVVIAVFVIVAGVVSFASYETKQPIEYRENLKEVVITVDEQEITLGDLAYYIAAEELEINEQARVYDMENTNTYWGLRLSAGKFLKTEAKQLILDTAVHDEIFYQMAMESGVTLDEEEQRILELKNYDFWSDLTEEQQERIGVTKEQLLKRMERIALAQKYQFAYALENSIISEDYNVDGEGYQALLDGHEVKINQSIWKRVPFGAVVIETRDTQTEATEN